MAALRAGCALMCAVSSMGCKSAESLKQECLRGEASSCRAACDKGVTGDGGCFHAARELRRNAGADFDRPAWAEARQLFHRACEGGHAEACILAAESIAAPYAGDERPPMKVRLISDVELSERQRVLNRACELGGSSGCKRLADATIGKTTQVALAAHEKACRSSKESESCLDARRREVQAFEHYRAGCKKGIADDCTSLGDLVYRVDVPRARRLFAAEGELRGVAALVGGSDAFVEYRSVQARTAAVPDPTAERFSVTRPAPKTTAPGGPPASTVRLEAVTVQGRLSKSSVDRALRDGLNAVTRCAETKSNERAARMVMDLVVDRTADIWRTAIVETTASEAFGTCVTEIISSLSIPGPIGGIATVRFTLSFEP